MTTYFVTRHTGAIEWAQAHNIEAQQLPHLDPNLIKVGDRVLGTLPVNIAALICAKGAEYWHLVLEAPPEYRGAELSADTMTCLGAHLRRFNVQELSP